MFQDFGQCTTTNATLERDMNALNLDLSLSSHTRELLQFCYFRLLTRGAQVSTHFHTDVTHVLIPSPTLLASDDMHTHRINRIQERMKLLKLGASGSGLKTQNVKIVYPEWMEESIRALKLVEASPTNAFNTV
jgi:hypothetical protein